MASNMKSQKVIKKSPDWLGKLPCGSVAIWICCSWFGKRLGISVNSWGLPANAHLFPFDSMLSLSNSDGTTKEVVVSLWKKTNDPIMAQRKYGCSAKTHTHVKTHCTVKHVLTVSEGRPKVFYINAANVTSWSRIRDNKWERESCNCGSGFDMTTSVKGQRIVGILWE